MKQCPYCQKLKPVDTFHYLSKGRGGRLKVAQCDDCYQGRKNPEASKQRLAKIVEDNKAANKRTYTGFTKEPLR